MDVSGRFVSFIEQGQRDLPTARAKSLTRKLELNAEKMTKILAIYDEFNSLKRK